MLVNYYMIERSNTRTADWNTAYTALADGHTDASGVNIPNFVCTYFSAETSKYVVCIDSAINVQEICTTHNFPVTLVQSSTIDDSTYNREYNVGIDDNKNYILFKIIKRPPLPDVAAGQTGADSNLSGPNCV